MKILLIAPHQDDEILAAGGFIQLALKKGHSISILFITNGDYHGREIAKKRYFESRDALKLLGVPEKKIFYLGYADTGMNNSHSFLKKLYLSNRNQSLVTPFSATTYHPAGYYTVHALRDGCETCFSHKSLLSDLSWFIKQQMPNLMVIPHPDDQHGDHAMIYSFLQEINIYLKIPPCISYIIHGGSDSKWPNKSGNNFIKPPIISSSIWGNRIIISLDDKMTQRKLEAIQLFKTQINTDSNGFLFSFVKKEEVFLLISF